MKLKSIIKISILLFFSFLLPSKLSAQIEFLKGFIIKNNGDTILGEIQKHDSYFNPKACVFKSGLNDSIVTYTAEDIHAYRFTNGKFYISKLIQINDGNKVVFLEYIIDGIIDFFYLNDPENRCYFILTENGEFIKLMDNEKEAYINGKLIRVKSHQYIGVLKYATMKSPTIMKMAENSSLSHKSLMKIGSEYNNEICSENTCIVYEKQKDRATFSYGPMLGLNMNYFTINAAQNLLYNYYYLRNSKFSPAFYPSFGLFAEYTFPIPIFSLKYELGFNLFSNKSNQEFTEDNTVAKTSVKFSNTNITNTFLFRYQIQKFNSTLEIGYYLNNHLKSDFYRETVQTYTSPNNPAYSYVKNFSSTENILNYPEQGLTVGFGKPLKLFRKNDLSINLRYNIGQNKIVVTNENTEIMGVTEPVSYHYEYLYNHYLSLNFYYQLHRIKL